jgi:RHS repeat-associated protein
MRAISMRKLLRPLMLLGAALGLGAGLAAAVTQPSGPSLGNMVLLPAAQITVAPDPSLPAPVQQLETLHVGNIADQDTTSSYTAFGKSTITVSFPAQSTVQALRVHGSAPYKVQVLARANAQGAFKEVPVQGGADLTALPQGAWNVLALPASVTASDIQLVLTPQQSGGTGLSEIEFWGQGSHGNMAALGSPSFAKPLAPQAIEAPATNAQNGQVSLIGDPAAGGTGASFTMKLPLEPSAIARAWLVYELSGAGHWSEAARSINGAAVQGGYARETGGTGFALQAEPISPASLVQGQNTIAFSNFGGLPPYQVRNVRLVAEPFDGWNWAASATGGQGPANEVLDGDGTTGFSIYPLNAAQASSDPQLTVQLSQTVAIDSLRFQLSKALDGTVSVDLLQAGKWQTVAADLPGAGFAAGWNTLPLSQGKASAVRLRFGGGSSTALLAEFAVTGSPVETPAATPQLVATFPDNGQYYGDTAYVRGFVTPLQDGTGPATVTVAGKPIALSQGTFETAVSQADLGLASGTTNWSVTVQASYPGGTQVQRTVQFTNAVNATLNNQAGGTAADLVPGTAQLLTAQGASLETDGDAVAQKTHVTMKPLHKVDLAALGHGLINVTRASGSHGAAPAAAAAVTASGSVSTAAANLAVAGYRFLPHGQQFRKPVKVHLPYDKAKLPAGMKESDIKTFYFDRVTSSWQALQTAKVDTAKGEVVALTTHFTDMINGVVQTPDTPEATSFNPTQLKDIKVANPGAKVNLIAPPQANASGDVRLSYPIEVPPGRTGHAPQLALSYNSSAGNGWVGEGWDLGISSVSIDTRWGVPRYLPTLESETYTFDGEMLAPVAHRSATLADRTPDKKFEARIEGAFRKIIRHGSLPSNYWWEVREKDGTAYYYGGDPTANAPVPGAVLADASGNIFKWALLLVEDTNGNTIHYHYTTVADTGTGGGASGTPGTELYIASIDYTGVKAAPGAYTVTFTRDRDLPNYQRRADPIISARGGFKMVTADLLSQISVSFNGQAVRSYQLAYKTGAYNKSLLTTLTQYDASGALFNQHQFTYWDEARDGSSNYLGFTSSAWSTASDNVPSALGGQQGSGGGGHLYVGVSPYGNKSFSVGAKIGSSFSDSSGLVALVDIDGDGLPDKVYYDSGSQTFSYHKNMSGPGGQPSFNSTSVPLVRDDGTPVTAISQEHTDMTSAGPEAYAGFAGVNGFVGYNMAFGQAQQSIYFSDVNGDGLVDLVVNGTVWFNYLDNGVPKFTTDSTKTPNPIGPAAIAANLTSTQQAAAHAKLDAANPRVDTVTRWVAPYTGTVAITAPVALLQNAAAASYKTADGVRVAIQHNASELWFLQIDAGDYATKTPTGVSAVSVSKGDTIYFRVQSNDDGAYDQVSWAPQIAYQNASPVADSNNLNPYSYSEQADFTLHGLRQAQLGVPYNGTMQVTAGLNKLGPTSDDVSLVLYKNGAVAASQLIPAASTGITAFSQSVSVLKTVTDKNGKIVQGDKLELRIVADSRIGVTQLAWDPANPPTAVYTSSPDVPAGGALPSIALPVSADLYPASDLATPVASYPAVQGSNTVTATVTFDSSLSVAKQGTVVVTAKKPGVLLAKQTLTFTGSGTQSVPLTFNANANDPVFFEFHVRDSGMVAGISSYDVSGASASQRVLYSATSSDVLPQDYRGWTHFGYNGQGANAKKPISITEADLTLSDLQNKYNTDQKQQDYRQKILDAAKAGADPSTVAAPFHVNLYPYLPQAANSTITASHPQATPDLWQGPDASLWVSASAMSSSRRGSKFIPSATSDPNKGQAAPVRWSQNTQTSISGGVAVAGVDGSVSATASSSQSVMDFKDLNGDGYPDVIAGGQNVMFSPMIGGIDPKQPAIDVGPGKTEGTSGTEYSIGVGGTYASGTPNYHGDMGAKGGAGAAGGASGNSGLQMPSLGLGGNYETGSSAVNYNLLDINGDGLPDRVCVQSTSNAFQGSSNSCLPGLADGTVVVQINLGYKFADPEVWGTGASCQSQAQDGAVDCGTSQGEGVSGGFNDGIYGFAGGVNFSNKTSASQLTLFDVNGDGLPDLVTRASTSSPFMVAFNTGAGFASPMPFPSAVGGATASTNSAAQAGGFYFQFSIYYVVVNPGADFNTSQGSTGTLLADIDGDGYPDFLASGGGGDLQAAINTRGRTNLLKNVTRPLGGSFEVAYDRSGNTYGQEASRWVLSRLTVYDGLSIGGQNLNGQDTEVTAYSWSGGYYDRREREFYGFAQCVESQLDPATGTPYRTVTRTYNLDNYYLKGLIAEETLADAAGNKYTDATYKYNLVSVTNGQAPADLLTAVAFPEHIETDKYWFEGQAAAGKTTKQTFAYDYRYGNVTDYVDYADASQAQVESKIGYWLDLTGSDYIIKANAIEVYGGGKLMRKRTATFEPHTGNLLDVTKYLADNTTAVTTLAYDIYGNIATATGPANATGQHYAKTYTYDTAVHTYVTSVTDSFGYKSTAAYDLRFGEQTGSTDINNQTVTTSYDHAGRAVSIVGPYEQGTGRVTIAMQYHPSDPSRPGNPAISWAHTAHIDLNRGPSATIDTATFTDGLERVVQTKKSLALYSSGTSVSNVMSVSGRVLYDGFGRAIEQYYPTTGPTGQMGTFAATPDKVKPTVTTYDVLDRPLSVVNPANEATHFAYGFGQDRNKLDEFFTRVTDADGNPRDTFRNVHDDITSVLLHNGNAGLWTSYAYDPLDEIVAVKDNAGHVTSAVYDDFGRRTTLASPDAGTTAYVFDTASNLTQKITANLKAAGQAVHYTYNYNRLQAVTYPKFPGNNVAYTYGGPGAAGNGADRVIGLTAQGGTLTRAYGPLGEVVQEVRTPAQTSVQGPNPVFTTHYTYDTWNRIQSLTYPDGEVVSFNYDSGGNIQSISGKKQANTYNYLSFMGYDKFEAREHVVLGNGTVTNYAYNPLNRRMTGLVAQTKSARTFMNMAYGYDAVGNIKKLANSAAIPPNTALWGGTTAYTFNYDQLYQLTGASGAFAKPNMPTQEFSLAMSYDGIHNITHKTQTAFNLLSNGSKVPNNGFTYDWAYAYGGGRPHAASLIGDEAFHYDADGNQTGWNATDSGQNRVMVWDEDDRLQSVTDNSGQPTTFKYDDNTNRVIKKGAGGETLYVNPWYVAALGRNSKQIFAGATRIVSKLETFPSGEGYGTGAKNLTEVYQYFYHQDHLGSTGYVSDATGEVYQHLEYFPFGETWVDEVADDARVPYRFTGQEYDPETRLYYYGARYYDPRTSAWENFEPALGTFLNAGKAHDVLPSVVNGWRANLAGAGMGGMFNPRNFNGFGYAHQNPVKMTDPDGRVVGADDALFWGGLALLGLITAEGIHEQQQHSNSHTGNPPPVSPARPELSGTPATPPNPFDPRQQSPQPARQQPGRWVQADEYMSVRAQAYQEQIGGRTGQVYEVNGVKFDAYNGRALIDAKGPGYGDFVRDGQFKPWFSGRQALLEQAQRQTVAARGVPIEWHVAEGDAAGAMRSLLQSEGYSNITVIHTPVVTP